MQKKSNKVRPCDITPNIPNRIDTDMRENHRPTLNDIVKSSHKAKTQLRVVEQILDIHKMHNGFPHPDDNISNMSSEGCKRYRGEFLKFDKIVLAEFKRRKEEENKVLVYKKRLNRIAKRESDILQAKRVLAQTYRKQNGSCCSIF